MQLLKLKQEIDSIVERLGLEAAEQAEIGIFVKGASGSSDRVDIDTVASRFDASGAETDIAIFPAKHLEVRGAKILMTVEQTIEFLGPKMKKYKLQELCRDRSFYPVFRMPGPEGRGRSVYIHREKLLQWLDEQIENNRRKYPLRKVG